MNTLNKSTLLFFSVSTLIINGCASKNEFETKYPTRFMVSDNQVQSKNTWNKTMPSSIIPSTKKEDCLDCYATPMDDSVAPLVSNTFIKVLDTPAKIIYPERKRIDTKHYGRYGYTEKASDTSVKVNNYVSSNQFVTPAVSYVNSSYSSYGTYGQNADTAIQVGAFRQYDGAERYMRRYNVLSNKYKVTIKTISKNNRPLYRVRIEGFRNQAEAKKFMYSYGIRNAFVVIK